MECNICKQSGVGYTTSNLSTRFYIHKSHIKGGGGGEVQAYHFGKKNFELGVGREGHDTSQHFEGSFESIRAILPMRGLGAKTGAKTKILTKGNRAMLLSPFDLSSKNEHLKNNLKIG